MTQKEGEELGTSRLGFVLVNDTTEEEKEIYYDAFERTEPTGMYKMEYESHEQYAFYLSAIFNIYSYTAFCVTCL